MVVVHTHAEPPSVIGYHAIDYNLFYFNIRANVKERIASFFNETNWERRTSSRITSVEGFDGGGN